MRLRETQGNVFSLSDKAGLRSKKAAKAEGGPSNLPGGHSIMLNIGNTDFIAKNLANALEIAHGSRVTVRDINV